MTLPSENERFLAEMLEKLVFYLDRRDTGRKEKSARFHIDMENTAFTLRAFRSGSGFQTPPLRKCDISRPART